LRNLQQNSNDPEASSLHKKLVLPCGHALCESCLKEWVKKSVACPICRQDIDSTKQQPNRDDRNNQSSSSAQRFTEILRSDLLMPELLFRLRNAQTMYPDFITDDMVDDWSRDVSHTGTFEVHRLVDHQVRSRALAAAQESSGRYGNSSSFGGGSGGGGGAGGSW